MSDGYATEVLVVRQGEYRHYDDVREMPEPPKDNYVYAVCLDNTQLPPEPTNPYCERFTVIASSMGADGKWGRIHIEKDAMATICEDLVNFVKAEVGVWYWLTISCLG